MGARFTVANGVLRVEPRPEPTCPLLQGALEMLQGKADAIYAQIKDAAHADTVKMFSNDSFDWGLMDIKGFAASRYADLQMQLGN